MSRANDSTSRPPTNPLRAALDALQDKPDGAFKMGKPIKLKLGQSKLAKGFDRLRQNR